MIEAFRGDALEGKEKGVERGKKKSREKERGS